MNLLGPALPNKSRLPKKELDCPKVSLSCLRTRFTDDTLMASVTPIILLQPAQAYLSCAMRIARHSCFLE